jgi:hypothetical protein
MRSTRSSNDDARVPDPSILTPPAGRSRDLQGTTKLECRCGVPESAHQFGECGARLGGQDGACVPPAEPGETPSQRTKSLVLRDKSGSQRIDQSPVLIIVQRIGAVGGNPIDTGRIKKGATSAGVHVI